MLGNVGAVESPVACLDWKKKFSKSPFTTTVLQVRGAFFQTVFCVLLAFQTIFYQCTI